MVIAVASGKGGTGKTTVAVNLALSLDNVQFIDCDVEEPNAHIFLRPVIGRQNKAYIPVPQIDEAKCNYCGQCKEVCVYNAIAVLSLSAERKGSILTFPNLCHGCGACAALCPQGAITEINREIGLIETGSSGDMQFVHGRLNIGEAMSPPLIRAVKNNIDRTKTVIIDAPPGTSCPVVAAVRENDFCVLVTEPTPFGLNDLRLTVEVLREINIPFGVVINRADLGDNKTLEYCLDENIPVLMCIPFKKDIAQAYSRGETLLGVCPGIKQDFINLYKAIEKIIEAGDKR